MEVIATSRDRALELKLKGELDHHGARDMLRELEFSSKIMSVCHKSYIDPVEILKMATTNVCGFGINDVIQKSVILEDNFAEFNIFNSFSKNPYLNIINRVETKNILYTINKIVNV